MGGKKTQRTKNNVKPSSSSRSAELLGAAVSSFVGFSAHSELGLVAFVPGFVTTEQLPESYDINISPQLQLILRKMSKKDPLTKQKALQELIELVNTSELDVVKSFLPLWPKFYQNLATDTEHNVRELAQTVLQLLVSKCKRAVAPTLKLIVPIWLVSHFDTYAPAASIARASFRETFTGTADRTCEVCLHCQSEIMDYTGRNLTFHTSTTLSSGKNLAPEEAEQKYQRVVIGSLKALSFFLEHTAEATDLSEAQSHILKLLGHPKFWSFAKHKVLHIKAAWFELLYHILQSPSMKECRAQMKVQITKICFQNIHESDPVVAPQVWGCILQVQIIYEDWYLLIPLKDSILPKLSLLLRNGFNRNAVAISPNLLPFFSKMAHSNLPELDSNKFCKQFFDDIKASIMSLPSSSKSDLSAIIKAYFECLRYQFQMTNNAVECRAEYEALAIHLLNDNILEPIEAFLASDNVAAKLFFQHSSALVAFWADRQRGDESLYSHLLDTFWICVFRLITEGISNEAVHDRFLEHVLELIHDLQVANPSLEVASVKFADDSIADRQSPTEREAPASSSGASTALQSSASFIQEKLRQLVVQLVRLCLDNVRNERGSQYIGHVRRHMHMFGDAEFYAALSEEHTIAAALDLFVELLYTSGKTDGENNDEPDCAAESRRETNEVVIEIIFEILGSIPKSDQFAYIRQYLLIIPHEQIQTLVLEQLVSFPLCVEPEVRSLLAEPTVCGFIANIASKIVAEHKKEELNLLHKCFFQTDDGEILIDPTTVDIILETLSEPLIVPTAGAAIHQLDDMVDACGSFIAQIMPVVCSHANASEGARRFIFLKLFRFTMERTPNEYISEDTFWEITTCWQDALSSDDIVIDRVLLEDCAAAVEHGMLTETLSPVRIETMAEAVAKFVICATENVEDPGKRLQRIEEVMAALLRTARAEDETEQRAERHLEEYCALRETLKGAVTSAVELKNSGARHLPLHAIFSRALINVSTILKLVCRASAREHRSDDVAIETGSEAAEEEEVTEDYCDPNEFLLEHWSESLFAELRKCIRIAAIGDSLINNETQVDPAVEALMLQLSECVRTLMRDGAGLAMQLSERMLQQACDDEGPTVCRPLLYLAFSEQYAHFEENAPILLNEALLEYFVPRKALCAYVNTLQYLLPQLLPRSISLQCAIMGTEPEELWLRAAILRCLVINNFDAALNKKDDKAIVIATLEFVTLVAERQHAQRDMLLYNIDLRNVSYSRIVDTTEYINLLVEVVKRFPHELDIKHWDTVRIGLSSWMLTASQSIDGYAQPKIAAFVGSVARLFVALSHFVVDEKSRSSTELLASVVDEWQSLFARDVNLVLFKAFFKLARLQDAAGDYIECFVAVLDEVISAIELIHYGVVYAFCSHSEKITLDTLCNFLLKNLSNPVHSVRTCCVYIMHHLTQSFVAADIAIFEKRNEALLVQQQQSTKWHFLNRFEDYIGRYSLLIQKYLNEFSFKLSEIPDLTPIDRHEGLSYLLLWDCIVYACANAPVTLRSLYTNWLHEHKYEENLLLFLFRAMPAELLRNHDSKLANHSDIFRALTFAQIKDRNLSLERYTCHMYAEVLRKLPAVVRRWWNTCPSRQKTFVDKLTTQFVSTLICNDELRSIGNIKDKLENMQVTVHTSTREVLAMYTIDEVRMELVITLSPNYPLGAVKVDCGKQIGNKSASRNFSMQLTIFLTHQNGTIYDGLTMWKNNLDKKFEGVEECYVCYTVIHQDTCQLPKLTCKTCKKKFHGPCLFKWFTTSSKSTCPICRNIF